MSRSYSGSKQPTPRDPITVAPLSKMLLFVMAIASGVSAATIYYNQPILELLQQAFPRSITTVHFVPILTQLGFACGLFFLVPLGDRINRRLLILWQFGILVIALGVAAASPNAVLLVVASAVLGITASVAQQIVPFAAELAEPHRRGQVIGTVMSGVLCGILLGRVVGGVIGQYFGWRVSFGLGAIFAALTGIILAFMLPYSQPKTQDNYLRLMASLWHLFREEPALRRAMAIQAALFGSFIGLWTILALRLHTAFHLGANVAGLLGVAGIVGILMAPLAGKIADHRGPQIVISLGSLVMLLSYVIFGLWGSMMGLIIGIILLDFGEQSALISNQHVIYSLRPEARSRVNTLFMTAMFIGGAVGSWGVSLSWQLGGWNATTWFGGALVLLGLFIHFSGRLASSTRVRRRR